MVKDYTPGARLCSKTAATELGFTNFLHSMGALTGFKEVIDTYVTTDHYNALDEKKREMQQQIDGMRWTTIQVIMDSQTSKKLYDENPVSGKLGIDVDGGIDENSMKLLHDMLLFMDRQGKLNKQTVQDKLNLFNFAAIANTIFLYIISFVLIVFVEWN
tara:strand:- start:251 stop:727 length:477 start_codon:yes stop_codon:yes gene_type:complete